MLNESLHRPLKSFLREVFTTSTKIKKECEKKIKLIQTKYVSKFSMTKEKYAFCLH